MGIIITRTSRVNYQNLTSKVITSDISVRIRNHHPTKGNHMPYEITQYYLPLGSSDFPAFTSAEASTCSRYSDHECKAELKVVSNVLTTRMSSHLHHPTISLSSYMSGALRSPSKSLPSRNYQNID